ncbi:conserved hypothetical protein [groundwater metagenome]|uniref:DUF5678 domain-containing protein n=1 Tax=groundwater metagenome TaxID=717931 RepID=A0A098E9T3_9ZZZZ
MYLLNSYLYYTYNYTAQLYKLSIFEFFIKTDIDWYKGQHIALVGDKIVAIGGNAKVVRNETKKKTGKVPSIVKILKDDALVL